MHYPSDASVLNRLPHDTNEVDAWKELDALLYDKLNLGEFQLWPATYKRQLDANCRVLVLVCMLMFIALESETEDYAAKLRQPGGAAELLPKVLLPVLADGGVDVHGRDPEFLAAVRVCDAYASMFDKIATIQFTPPLGA